MLNSLPISIGISTILGILSGLGVGGGSLLILWLTLVVHVSPQDARIINLLFFIPCALSATLYRWKKGNIALKEIWPGMTAGCLAAIGGALLAKNIDVSMLKKLFGLLLLVTGMREIFYRPRNAR